MRPKALLLALMPAAVVLGGAVPFLADSPIEQESELFPAGPAVNDQRGFAIAMDGEWLAIGARLEDLGDLDNAGAVHIFHFDAAIGTWKEKATLTSNAPEEEGQFGFALSLRENRLAVGAVGERRVHVFTEADGAWSWTASLGAPATGFGRSVAIDGLTLAVGAADPHGRSAGAVYLSSGPSWNSLSPLTGDPAKPEERFGHAVALQDDILAVGAPGADSATGAVYVFERRRGRWATPSRTAPRAAAPGDQVGFAVAVDGGEVAVGAPTEGEKDAGGVWALWRQGQTWKWSPLPDSEVPGGQLGYAVDIENGRIAAGAPLGGGQLFGSVHLFSRTAEAWSELAVLQADNDDPLDLSGTAVAMSGDWVMFGAALRDHGGNAAGSVASFLCEPGEECLSTGDVVIAGPARQEVFGISVAADGDLFAVGARSEDPNVVRGSVTLYRKAAQGWRQEQRFVSGEDLPDQFGDAVALHQDSTAGDLLVVGDPVGNNIGGADPEFDCGGRVHLFRRSRGTWEREARLSRYTCSRDGFGRSVATDGSSIAVGAAGAAYFLRKNADGEWEEIKLDPPVPQGSDYGAAVAVQGDMILVGAPQASRVFVFTGGQWTQSIQGALGSGFGAAVAVDGDTLAVGAPRRNFFDKPDAGAVFLFERSGNEWKLGQNLPMAVLPRQGLGSSVALRGGYLLVGAPVIGDDPDDPDGIVLFQRQEGEWKAVSIIDAIPRLAGQGGELRGDHFGSAVAIGEGFFAVTSPGETGGDRVTVFGLRTEEGEP